MVYDVGLKSWTSLEHDQGLGEGPSHSDACPEVPSSGYESIFFIGTLSALPQEPYGELALSSTRVSEVFIPKVAKVNIRAAGASENVRRTMSTLQEDERGCTVRADGTLKEAHEIEWQNDPDDDNVDLMLPGLDSSMNADSQRERKRARLTRSNTNPRRRPKTSILQFLDIEAVEDRECDDDDMSDEAAEGFIDDEDEEELEPSCHKVSFFNSLESVGQDEQSSFLEDLARRYTEAETDGTATMTAFQAIDACQRAGFTDDDMERLPKKGDLPLWEVPTKACYSREFSVQLKLTQRAFQWTDNNNGKPLHFIGSIVHKQGFPGRLFIEAESRLHVLDFCDGIPDILYNDIKILTPLQPLVAIDYIHHTQAGYVPIEDSWVRMGGITYRGDVAYVLEVDHYTKQLTLILPPRIHYARLSTKQCMRRITVGNRPAPKALDLERLRSLKLKHKKFIDKETEEHTGWEFRGDIFDLSGFLVLERVESPTFLHERAEPTREELNLFHGCCLIPEDKLYRYFQQAARHALSVSEKVCVDLGEEATRVGHVTNKFDDVVELILLETNNIIRVPVDDVRCWFDVGDRVEVAVGKEKGFPTESEYFVSIHNVNAAEDDRTFAPLEKLNPQAKWKERVVETGYEQLVNLEKVVDIPVPILLFRTKDDLEWKELDERKILVKSPKAASLVNIGFKVGQMEDDQESFVIRSRYNEVLERIKACNMPSSGGAEISSAGTVSSLLAGDGLGASEVVVNREQGSSGDDNHDPWVVQHSEGPSFTELQEIPFGHWICGLIGHQEKNRGV
ncbi:Transcription elongation factor SPT5 [Leucoagaricus sp. SymC.cos]|nr:Transcription elongation factor SPT5 [Leucoagaricus sp. SymC.cos]